VHFSIINANHQSAIETNSDLCTCHALTHLDFDSSPPVNLGRVPDIRVKLFQNCLNIRNYRLQTETSFELLLDAGAQIPVGNRGWAFCGFVEAALQQKPLHKSSKRRS
jgi:hypothetical protein